MASLSHQCPHCLVESVALRIVAQTSGDAEYVHLHCPQCGKPSSAEVSNGTGGQLGPVDALPFGIQRYGWWVVRIWPHVPVPCAPAHLPDPVLRAFLAGEKTRLQRGLEDASAGSYRKALEVGTKLIASQMSNAAEFEGKSLSARIDMLRKHGRLTPELAEWAHQIRSIGNEAMHELDATTEDELVALQGFTEMVLTYLFTLPGMLDERKAAAGKT